MTQKQSELCASKTKYADLWDGTYGVTDSSVVPDSYASGDGQLLDLPAVKKTQKPSSQKNRKKRRFRLGDQVESALQSIGVTKERVEKWIGGPCNCPERKRNWNALSDWAQDVLFGKLDVDEGATALNDLIGQQSLRPRKENTPDKPDTK